MLLWFERCPLHLADCLIVFTSEAILFVGRGETGHIVLEDGVESTQEDESQSDV